MITGIVVLSGLAGCATSPWHEDLMSNNELVAANCQQLAVEQRKVEDNAMHASEAGTNGGIAAVFLTVLESAAAIASGTTLDTNNSAGINQASLADEHNKQSRELDERKNLISMLRHKKGCA